MLSNFSATRPDFFIETTNEKFEDRPEKTKFTVNVGIPRGQLVYLFQDGRYFAKYSIAVSLVSGDEYRYLNQDSGGVDFAKNSQGDHDIVRSFVFEIGVAGSYVLKVDVQDLNGSEKKAHKEFNVAVRSFHSDKIGISDPIFGFVRSRSADYPARLALLNSDFIDPFLIKYDSLSFKFFVYSPQEDKAKISWEIKNSGGERMFQGEAFEEVGLNSEVIINFRPRELPNNIYFLTNKNY